MKCSKKCPAYFNAAAGVVCTLHVFGHVTSSKRNCRYPDLNGAGNDGFYNEMKEKVIKYRKSLKKGKPPLRRVSATFAMDNTEIEEAARIRFNECMEDCDITPDRKSVNMYWDHREIVVEFDMQVTCERDARSKLRKMGYSKEDIDGMIEDEYQGMEE